jgi:hypothetical protein
MKALSLVCVLLAGGLLCSCTTYSPEQADAMSSSIACEKEGLAGKDILGTKPDSRNLPDWRR